MVALPPDALCDIQGIILSPYGHLNFGAYVFLQIRERRPAKAWLAEVIPHIATSERWDKDHKPQSATHIGFTHAAFEVLGLPETTLLSFPPEFIDGMPSRNIVLGDTGDSAPDNWELGGTKTDAIHIVLMLLESTQDALDKRLADVTARVTTQGSGVAIVAIEQGCRPESQVNPFGFYDGISQPEIEGVPGRTGYSGGCVKTGEFVLGYLNEYGVYPPSPTLPASEDPSGILPSVPSGELPQCRDFGHHGSYTAYRKLETHVASFWQFIEQNAYDPHPFNTDQTVKSNMIWLASKLFGRWPSGVPVVLAPDTDPMTKVPVNDFCYEPTDTFGLKCPIGAHIRRANPRDSIARNTAADSLRSTSRHRIVRRAVYYGERDISADEYVQAASAPTQLARDGKSQGLHFFAINADLARQFEFVQQSWCNQSSFNGLYDNKDPIIGDNDGTRGMTIERDPVRKRINNIPRFVSVKGGAYFFLPSVTALRFLSRAT